MRLEQVQAFLLVAQLKSFQQAALANGVTQSTISRQLQALETALGCQLIHRGQQANLTVAGELFFRRAQRICQEWETSTLELGELLQGKQSELCVAAIHSVCVSALPPLLPRFCERYPAIQLRVTALGSDRALKVLRDGLVDTAIIMGRRGLETTKEWVVTPLYTEPIALLMGASHPLAQEAQVTWAQVAEYPQAVFKEGYRMRGLVEEGFSQRGLSPRICLELNVPDSFYGVAAHSEMVALLPQSLLVPALNNPQLAIRSLVPPPQRQVAIATTADRLKIPLIADFYHLVVERLTA
ncbi:MAG: LysR family transcriptional regulator [Cyanobacteria bacterium RI_101]|nr:LysR family transcriptional regulator [Cyanobacteria bacterium RI_101]